MARNWSLFQACLLSPEDYEKVRGHTSRRVSGFSNNSRSGLDPSMLVSELQERGWTDGLPPLYRHEERLSSTLYPAGFPHVEGYESPSSDVPVGVDFEIPTSVEGGELKSPPGCYPRDWRGYNSAQTHEESDVKGLLGGFCEIISLIEGRLLGPRGKGRPRWPLGDVVLADVLKVYRGVSSRRFQSPLREAAVQGYLRNGSSCASSRRSNTGPDSSLEVSDYPKFNTVSELMRSDWLMPLLLELVSVTAAPLQHMETEFAIDGTGLSTRIFGRWLVEKPKAGSEDEGSPDGDPVEDGAGEGNEIPDEPENVRHDWMKLHALCGVKTNIIFRAAISSSRGADTSYFRGLVTETHARFNLQGLGADKAYSSTDNHDLLAGFGIEPRIPFKRMNVRLWMRV